MSIPPLDCLLHTLTVDGFDDNWLSYERGEILYTDGIIRFLGPNNDKVLLAQNEARQVGCKSLSVLSFENRAYWS